MDSIESEQHGDGEEGNLSVKSVKEHDLFLGCSADVSDMFNYNCCFLGVEIQCEWV